MMEDKYQQLHNTQKSDGSRANTAPTRGARTVWSSSRKHPGRPTPPRNTQASESDPPSVARPQRTGATAPSSGSRYGRNQTGMTAPAVSTEVATPLSSEAPGRIPGQRPPRMPRRTTPAAELPPMDDLLIGDCPAEDAGQAGMTDEYRPDAADLDRILNAHPCQPRSTDVPDIIPEGKTVIVGVRFRTGGKTYFFAPGPLTCSVGQHAIVETARGLEFGEICIGNRMVDETLVAPPLRPIIRIATQEDMAHNQENHRREADAYRIGVEKIAAHKLDMKLVAVQYTFDNSKLLFYFTSAGRVDFRELVKDLAGVFHIRIELRQIGIRDEARMIGGLGACGRPLCCATFLSDFGQVSMKMAKEQNLSLNSSKISGCCGRLMCCLKYECETYAEEIRRTPAVGSFVDTPDGPGVVTEILPLLGEVKVSLRNSPDIAPKKYKREEVNGQPPVSRSGEDGTSDGEASTEHSSRIGRRVSHSGHDIPSDDDAEPDEDM